MKIHGLLSIFSNVTWGKITDLQAQDVTSICFDSRRIEPGCVFVAIRGEKVDGHEFLAQAVAQGAMALVVQDASQVPSSFHGAVALCRDTREALNQMAARFYGEPATRLFCVGVTGTNGKTTTTYMSEAIFNHMAMPTGVIGTINHHLGSHIWKTEMTTPDPLAFQERLAQFEKLGARAVALEVSSHALRQCRVDEVPFDVAIFTNLSRDHLDYHKDMEDYFEAKAKLFTELLARSKKPVRYAIINDDDEYGRKLSVPAGVVKWTYGCGPSAHLKIRVLEQGFAGTRFELRTPVGSAEFKLQMTGLHNVLNATGAIGAGLAAGLAGGREPSETLRLCQEALSTLTGVSGRLEAVPNKKGVHVFVDYAHTDDAIRTVLHYLNAIRKEARINNRIITVFGCGGDRDRGKRPLMMKAALQGSDFVVVTSDNPRTENPDAIIDDAIAGAPSSELGKRVHREVDRKKGIRLALELAQPNDVVLIAGKGHEDYQQIGTTKYPFSDAKIVKEILA